MATRKDKLTAELEQIAADHGGIAKPPHVVAFAAENPDSELHKRFEWDDSKAGYQYRLWQAREIISVCVTILPHPDAGEEITTRVFVSLGRDRITEGGGYRHLSSVLSDKDMRAELLAEAAREAAHFVEKFETLQELASVHRAIRAFLTHRTEQNGEAA